MSKKSHAVRNPQNRDCETGNKGNLTDFINKIQEGDNLVPLSKLPDQCVDLVYVDGPYYSGIDWGDFDDRFDSMDSFIEFMSERLEQCHRVMKDTASIYLSCDYHASHHLRITLDEIFGHRNFINELIWDRNNKGRKKPKKKFLHCHENIFLYSKGKYYTFNMQYDILSKELQAKKFRYDDNDGKGLYRWQSLSRNLSKEKLRRGIKEGYYKWPKGYKVPYYKLYQADYKGTFKGTVIKGISSSSKANKVGFPGEKPEKLLDLLIKASSNPGDMVLDAFCGSGTACAVARKLGRRYMGFELNPRTVALARQRLEKI